MNLPDVLLAIAAGITILATLTHGLVAFTRRPPDFARLAFAAASLAAAVGAFAVLAMHSADSVQAYVAVTKWAFVPSSIGWTVATVWMVAFYTNVRPLRFLCALTAGFGFLLAADLLMPTGLLHNGRGELVATHVPGGTIMVISGSSPHILHRATEVLTVVAFLFLCYAVYRIYRASTAKAAYLGVMTVLLTAVALLDTLNEHTVTRTLATLYLTQISFAAIIVAVSLVLQRESLRQEAELRTYQAHLDELVEARVRELDEANANLERETAERRATEEVLRRRVVELDSLQRLAQMLAGSSSLPKALDEATSAITRLFAARYTRVRLLEGDRADEDGGGAAAGAGGGGDDGVPRLSPLDLAVSEDAISEDALIAGDVPTWPSLHDEVRRQAATDGIGVFLAAPLAATAGTAGALIITRDAASGGFSAEDRALAQTVSEALAAVIEIDRLHRKETRQAAAEERQALARDLHDAVTQSIYSASLIAEALPALWERDPEEGASNLERLRRLVRAALAEMRTLLFELRPSALETAPLDALIERLGDALAGQTQIDVKIEIEDVELPSGVKIAFYRVTQEAFSNIAKHARASAVTARVLAVDGGAALTVWDDGRGFDPAAVPSGHMGLHIMRERLERVAGTLSVESGPGQGTTISAVWLQTASDERPVERMGA